MAKTSEIHAVPGAPATPIGQRVTLAAIWIAAIAGWVLFQRSTGRNTVDTAQFFVDTARGNWWALVAFIAFYAARPIVLFPATVLTVAGGILFGPILGVVATVVGANLSAMVAYWIGRTLRGRGANVESIAGLENANAGIFGRWSTKMRSNSFATVLTMRLLFLPYDLVNYLAGFLTISPWPFLAATAIGSIPGTLAFTFAGSSIERVDEGLSGFDARIFAASVVLFVASLAVARLVSSKTDSKSGDG